jgi:hypothetical protein
MFNFWSKHMIKTCRFYLFKKYKIMVWHFYQDHYLNSLAKGIFKIFTSCSYLLPLHWYYKMIIVWRLLEIQLDVKPMLTEMQYRDMQPVLALIYVPGWNFLQVLSSIGKPKDWLNKKKTTLFDIYIKKRYE